MKSSSSSRRAFRIFYIIFFILLFLLTIGLLIITPIDAFRQAGGNRRIYNVFVIGGCYVLTAFLSAIIWLSRWWSDRETMKSIPKTWVPVEKGDVKEKVRKMIVASLNRSAVIAWDARPRIPTEPPIVVSAPDNREVFAVPEADTGTEGANIHEQHPETEKDGLAITIPPLKPVWGNIMHEGWSSPTSPDLPDIQYMAVILELPHLIEARAVSLAPIDPSSTTEPPMPDLRAVRLLQRPVSMGLREYIGHLTNVGIIDIPTNALEFLAGYEHARFSGRPQSESQFRDLMKQFSELLQTMSSLDPSVLDELENEDLESDIDGDATSGTTTPLTHRSRSLASKHSAISLSNTIRTAPSLRLETDGTPTRGQTFSTAPATPATQRSRRRDISVSPHITSFSRTRRPYLGSTDSSGSSLRSVSQGSVIRLSCNDDSGDRPYHLMIPGVQS